MNILKKLYSTKDFNKGFELGKSQLVKKNDSKIEAFIAIDSKNCLPVRPFIIAENLIDIESQIPNLLNRGLVINVPCEIKYNSSQN